MHKISIIGSGGSGKSTFARALGSELDLPVYHLDSLYWQPNWVEPSLESWAAFQTDLCKKDKWILDGNYGQTMDLRFKVSDTIIFLDIPAYICCWRILKRQLKYRNRVRPDMAEGCKERLSLKFVFWVLGYPRTRKPLILEKLKELKNKNIVVLKSITEVKKFCESTKDS